MPLRSRMGIEDTTFTTLVERRMFAGTTTSHRLWLGFGTITALLVLSVAAMMISLREAKHNVGLMAKVAGPRQVTAHALEIDVLAYALAVHQYAETSDPLAAVDAKNAAFRAERYQVSY